MKYYICREEPKLIEDKEDENLFIKEVFLGNSNRYTVYQDYGGNAYYKPTECKLTKGVVYHTSSYDDELIVDNNKNLHEVKKLRPFLEEYNFEIDEVAKRVIKSKEKKGDMICVEPWFYNFKEEKTIYKITVYPSNSTGLIPTSFSKTTVDISILSGIIYCYSWLREQTAKVYFLKKCLEGKAYKIKG